MKVNACLYSRPPIPAAETARAARSAAVTARPSAEAWPSAAEARTIRLSFFVFP